MSTLAAPHSRLITAPPVLGLAEHTHRLGPPITHRKEDLVAQIDLAGLRGRGGAGFPTAVKMLAVREACRQGWRHRSAVVVANGTEGEPASWKDKALLGSAPHTVLDGMVAAGLAVGADRAILCVERRSPSSVAAVYDALAERAGRDAVPIEIVETPSRYVAGEETALVAWLNGNPARPTYSPPRPSDAGVGGMPTLVDNVETLANIALIDRFGADWFRQIGTPEEPGSILVTLVGKPQTPVVLEVEIGTSLASLLDEMEVATGSGVLVGGYFGTWLSAAEARRARLSSAGLRPFGASLGCGLIAVMPDAPPKGQHCPLQEVQRVMDWLAASSAGQCGTCVNGLPAVAGAFAELASGRNSPKATSWLDRWTPMLVGGGACKLPDGAARFLESARRVFADHIEAHRRRGPCPTQHSALLPTPKMGGWR